MTLVIGKNSTSSVYKTTLQVTDEDENLLYQQPEPRSKPGIFKINLVPFRRKFLSAGLLKVYLAEDPANDMMKLPSKRNLLAEIHLK